jgi:hypothetical protein
MEISGEKEKAMNALNLPTGAKTHVNDDFSSITFKPD